MSDPVLLVGGGPGDPELLTLRAEQVLAAASTVVVDGSIAHLASGLAAEVLLAGGDLVAIVRGARPPVVRLYRGDPWLHPAHAAERDALAAAGITTEAVPGIAVSIGTATAAGVPTHHRHVSVAARIDGDAVEAVAPCRVAPVVPEVVGG